MADAPRVRAPTAPFNFAQHLIECNEGRAAKTAYIDDHGSLTYGHLAGASPRPCSRPACGARSACCCSCTTATTGRRPF